MTTTTYTKQFIQDKLSTDKRWVERGLIVLYRRQTQDEQQTKETIEMNGVGFNSSDSRYLSWVSEWLIKNKGEHLNDKHFTKSSKMVRKYWKQIKDIIEENEKNGR